MQSLMKTVFLNLIACFLGNGMLFATEPEKMEFPPIDKRFEELYNELKKEEDELLEKIKKQYPNAPQDAWQRYDEFQQKFFAPFKKEYAGVPACNGLPENINTAWSKEQFGTFLEQYTQCAAERNDLDPAKIDIVYDSNKESKIFTAGQKPVKLLIHKNKMYDALVEGKLNNGELYWQLYTKFVKMRFYEGKELLLGYMLAEEGMTTEAKNALNKIKLLMHDHALIIAAMQEEKVLNVLLYYGQKPENKDVQAWKNALVYLLKIKQIMQG